MTPATPPHAKTNRKYERIVPNEFLCIHEHPNKTNPESIIFEVSGIGLANAGEHESSKSMSDALKSSGGSGAVPAVAVGFGRDPQ